MKTYSSTVISEQAKELLRTLLAPTPIYKGEGDYEIGYESAKRDTVQSLESFIGGIL